MNKRITLLLNQEEANMLDDLVSKRGFRIQETFRMALRRLHRKELPLYIGEKRFKKLTTPKLSPEEKCEQDGGDVIMRNGVLKCVIVRGNVTFENILKPLMRS